MLVLRSRLKLGERAFSIAALRAWNSLPADLRATVNTGTFKKKSKMFLFGKFYLIPYLTFISLVLVVVGLVSYCCKPQPFVIISIIIIVL